MGGESVAHPGIVFLSDLHLGDPRWSPARYALFNSFLDEFVARYATHVVIGGDALEWIEYEVTSLARSLPTVVKLAQLAARGVGLILVPGNHDIDFCTLYLRTKVLAIIYPQVHLTLDGRSFHVEHGHFYDPTINLFPATAYFFTRWGGRVLDEVPPGVEDALGAFKRQLLSLLDHTTGQRGAARPELDGYVRHARDLAAKGQHDYVIFGHTHTKELVTLDVPGRTERVATYVNTGDWQTHSDFAYYCGSSMRLYSWETQRDAALAFAASCS